MKYDHLNVKYDRLNVLVKDVQRGDILLVHVQLSGTCQPKSPVRKNVNGIIHNGDGTSCIVVAGGRKIRLPDLAHVDILRVPSIVAHSWS